MGKKVEGRATGISIERNHPGCIWRIVHALQHQPNWHHVRKRMLPHRRRRGYENLGNEVNAADDGTLPESRNSKMENPLIEEQKGASQSTKGSVKSRIKAFISDEMSKRKRKHRRSTSYPTRLQLTRTDSIHRLRNSDFNPIENENFGPPNKMNRELLLKSLVWKTNSRLEKCKEKGYRKSLSFPQPGLSYKARRKFGSMEGESEFLWNNNKNICEDLNSGVKKDAEIKVPKKRFQNFRERIKHAMRENKKEMRRITMDAVFHKVPCGQKFSQYEKEGISDLRKAKEKEKQKCHSFKPLERSCFDESLDRYKQLYFSCFEQEAKNHISERLRLKNDEDAPKKTMGRLFSLPDLRAYYIIPQSGDLSGSSCKTPNKIGKIESNKFDEIEVSVAEENEILFHELVRGGNENRFGDSKTILENDLGSTSFVDFKVESLEGLALDDMESLTTPHKLEDQNDPILEIISNSLVSEEDANSDTEQLAISEVSIEKIETPMDSSSTELAKVPEASPSLEASKYGFVKYVLELSGFSKNESLGAWHSPQQPLDPSMFEEFYLDDQPIENLEKLLLFDLVNEALLEIYERSYTYCPIRLCSNTYTRRVPMGWRVVKEVWGRVSWHLDWRPESDQLLDEAMSRDLTESDNWMNLHFEAECVGLELEDMIFEDLLEELVSDELS